LSFTFITARQNSKANNYAKELVERNQAEDFTTARTNYIDSIGNKEIINLGPLKYTYNECKERQLNLG